MILLPYSHEEISIGLNRDQAKANASTMAGFMFSKRRGREGGTKRERGRSKWTQRSTLAEFIYDDS